MTTTLTPRAARPRRPRRSLPCPVIGCTDVAVIDRTMCATHLAAVRRVTSQRVLRLAPRADWRAEAVCLDMVDTDAFYPEQSMRPDPEVLAMCGTCPVRDDCLLEADANSEHGWWGGVSPRGRSRLIPKRSAQAA